MDIMGRVETAAATAIAAAHGRGAEAEISLALQTVGGRGAETERRTIVAPEWMTIVRGIEIVGKDLLTLAHGVGVVTCGDMIRPRRTV